MDAKGRITRACADVDLFPTFPAAAAEIVALAGRDTVDSGRLARAVGRDPALGARVLRLANSPRFAARKPVSSLEDAVGVLGAAAVKAAALGFSVPDRAQGSAAPGGYDLRAFWRRALIASAAARSFAERLGLACAEEASVCGLLMDLGVPLLAKAAPEYAAVIERMQAGHADCDTERRHVGLTHAELAAGLFAEWRVPDVLAEAVLRHHEPEAAAPASSELAKILNLAHFAADVLTSTGETRDVAAACLRERMYAWFGRGAAAVDEAVGDLAAGVDRPSDAVSAAGATPADAAALLESARTALARTALETAGELAKTKRVLSDLQHRIPTDPQTGLFTRGMFDLTLAAEWRRRAGSEPEGPLALLLCDVDRFKELCDARGRAAGDDALRRIGEAVRGGVRSGDACFRYQGSKIAVLATGPCGVALRAFAERVRRMIAMLEIAGAADGKAAISIGAASFIGRSAGREPSELVKAADAALETARSEGGDRAICEKDVV